ncbi:unnamed protein product, partial [Phaeothamnion confervicola]
PAPAAAAPAAAELNPADVARLTEMGFPEDQAQAALRAAGGNGDIAVEFLMNGIPEGMPALAADGGGGGVAPDGGAPVGGAATEGAPASLDALRRHPQFDALRRLVQSDPAALQQVLQQIGQQSPELLALIHSNQGEFIAMMNEPVVPATPAGGSGGAGAGAGGMGGLGGMGALGGLGGANPAQMAQMLHAMPPQQRAAMAAQMGVTPEQLSQVAQMIGAMPPDQFQQMMAGMSAVMGGGMGGMSGGMGGGGGNPNVIRLTAEEDAAVTRISELGFDRAEAAQAYLACDKNEAMAANLLMDGGLGGDTPMYAPPVPPRQPTAAPAPAP